MKLKLETLCIFPNQKDDRCVIRKQDFRVKASITLHQSSNLGASVASAM